MSTLIPTLVAYAIVKKCCEQIDPISKTISDLRSELDKVLDQIVKISPPAESGIGLLPGPVTLPSPVPVYTPGGRGIPVPVVSTPRPQTVTINLAQARSWVDTVRGLLDRMAAEDPCVAMLGCVAEGFRKAQLDQRDEHKRRKLLDKGFVVHYVNKPNWPKKVQHTSRK